jgi:hypothetical protein
MNLKRIGHYLQPLVLSVNLCCSIIMNTSGGNQDIKALIIYGILGLIFFSSGISLVRTTKTNLK